VAAARTLHIPLSGRNRRHCAAALRKAETHHRCLLKKVEAARRAAELALAEVARVECELWSTRQFLGGLDEPSPSVTDALHGGHELLEVQSRHCNQSQVVELAYVIWPRALYTSSAGALLREV
jgi:hypothetical protein